MVRSEIVGTQNLRSHGNLRFFFLLKCLCVDFRQCCAIRFVPNDILVLSICIVLFVRFIYAFELRMAMDWLSVLIFLSVLVFKGFYWISGFIFIYSSTEQNKYLSLVFIHSFKFFTARQIQYFYKLLYFKIKFYYYLSK